MGRGRKPLPPGEKKELFNCYLSKEEIERMKIICFRRSVRLRKKFSEGEFMSTAIRKAAMPKPPTEEQIEAYYALFPKQRP